MQFKSPAARPGTVTVSTGAAGHAHRGEEGSEPAAVGLGDVARRLAQLWSLAAGDDSHDDGVVTGLGGAGVAERVRGHPRMLGES